MCLLSRHYYNLMQSNTTVHKVYFYDPYNVLFLSCTVIDVFIQLHFLASSKLVVMVYWTSLHSEAFLIFVYVNREDNLLETSQYNVVQYNAAFSYDLCNITYC